jgi:diadenosine tetraphosphatase ApaH/serine/threonine PP2A family protein phosphatase
VEDCGVVGHTHQPGLHDEDLRFHGLEGAATLTLPLERGKKSFINVGSVGQPRDGDPRACYAVLEDERVTWHRVEYDFRLTMPAGARPVSASERAPDQDSPSVWRRTCRRISGFLRRRRWL